MERQDNATASASAVGCKPRQSLSAKDRALAPDFRAALNMRAALQDIPKSFSLETFSPDILAGSLVLRRPVVQTRNSNLEFAC